MLNKFVIVFAVIAAISVEIDGSENCDKLGTLFYEEISCKPIRNNPDDPCPSSYDCQHLDEKGEHCYYQGKKYKDKDVLPESAGQLICRSACFCNPAQLGLTRFTCAIFDCPEHLGGNILMNHHCLHTYDLGICCSTGHICPPFDNVTCPDDNNDSYIEGQPFSLTHTCTECICKKGFTEKYEQPFCRRKKCDIEVRQSNKIMKKCAPVYDKDSIRCCPRFFVCPSESDVFTPAQKETAFVRTCKFGEKEIKNGQVLHTTSTKRGRIYKIKCDCQLPPLLTCTIESYTYIEHYDIMPLYNRLANYYGDDDEDP